VWSCNTSFSHNKTPWHLDPLISCEKKRRCEERQLYKYLLEKLAKTCKLTLTLLKWRIWWAPNNTSKWQMGFNLAFKGLLCMIIAIEFFFSWFWLCVYISCIWFAEYWRHYYWTHSEIKGASYLIFHLIFSVLKPIEYTGEMKNFQSCCRETRREVNKWHRRVEELWSCTEHFPLKYPYIPIRDIKGYNYPCLWTLFPAS